MRRFAFWLAFLLSVIVAFRAERAYERSRTGSDGDKPLLYLPSGRYLKVVSSGYENLVADGIYLWAIQYYGEYEGAFRLQYLQHIFEVITDLDPRFIDAYYLGSLILNLEAQRPDEALRLLDKGIARNPDDWQLPFEAGFICYHELRDHARAANYFRLASKPDAPLVTPRLAAAMAAQADPGSAYDIWKSVYETATDPVTRKKAELRLRDIRIQADIATLEGLVQEFRRRHGFIPQRLDALVQAGLLRSVPVDPDGNAYILEHPGGRVRSLRGLRFAALPSPPIPHTAPGARWP